MIATDGDNNLPQLTGTKIGKVECAIVFIYASSRPLRIVGKGTRRAAQVTGIGIPVRIDCAFLFSVNCQPHSLFVGEKPVCWDRNDRVNRPILCHHTFLQRLPERQR